jgi:superfamily II DNA or RNA helicase
MDLMDESTLERLVGPTTFARGRTYARQGAVLTRNWTGDGVCLIGQVQGGNPEPYAVAVIVTCTPAGKLTDIDGACTCPVEFNCKHAVALLLADDQSPPDGAPEASSLSLVGAGGAESHSETPSPDPVSGRSRNAAGPKSRAPDWEAPLLALMAPDAAGSSEPGVVDVGLQFDLVLTPPDRGSRSNGPTTGIRLRPVVRTYSQNWVRTGISWSRLDQYHAYGRQARDRRATHLAVLTELLALSRLSNHRTYFSYSSADEAVWLQTVNSRRIWDLLAEARDIGLPMVQSGRQALPIELRPAPVPVVIDATRPRPGLELRPRVIVDGEDVELRSSLLIGEPAHGIVWWETSDGLRNPPTRLALASFEAPVDDHLRGLLAFGAIAVPPEDEDRFFRDLYPSLRRRIVVSSSDHSVDLPELPAARLVLALRFAEGHRVELTWSRSAVGATWREDLWGAPSRLGDRVAEDRIIESVTAALSSVPELFEPTYFGDRLAAEVELTGMAAVRFLSGTRLVLEGIDGVEVEIQGDIPDYREIVEAPVVELGGSLSGDNDWFDLTVTVTVDGEKVPFADLFVALAEDQTHLILPSGTFFSLDREELRQLAGLIAEARDLDDHAGEGLRLSRFQASLWEDLQQLGIVTAQAREWEQSVRALGEADDRTEHPVPGLLHATLRPYQVTGFNWLAYLFEHRLGGVLADDMGLGKTIQALAMMCHTWEQGLTDSPYLVVAPTSVVGNWAAECRRFAPDLIAVTVAETEKRRGMPLAEVAAHADIVITSYALFRIEYDAYAEVDWAGLFLDEAQFAKNRASQSYQRARMLPVPFKVAMTGTPIENNLMELWSLLSITAPGLFANPDRFTDFYRNPIEKKGNTERLAQLRRRVRPLMLRRTKEQVIKDLPEKQEQVLELDLHPRQKKLYQTYLQRERQNVLGLLGDVQKHRFEIFRSLTLLRQASLDMSLVDEKHVGVPSTKLDALMEILEEVAADGHRVLVFSQFTRFLTLARRRIERAGIQYCYLDGTTRKREVVIDEFRSGTAPVFLISLKAGGFGLNLTEADYCVILDPWWNPATEAQAVDRLHRIGQTKRVMVYRLVAKDTLEEKVMALKARKSALFSNVMDGGDFESGAMTADDIQELLS